MEVNLLIRNRSLDLISAGNYSIAGLHYMGKTLAEGDLLSLRCGIMEKSIFSDSVKSSRIGNVATFISKLLLCLI